MNKEAHLLLKSIINKIPVSYCSRCLNLNSSKIRINDDVIEYCPRCGHTHYEETSIDEWECMHEEMYGKYLLDMTKEEIRELNNMFMLKVID